MANGRKSDVPAKSKLLPMSCLLAINLIAALDSTALSVAIPTIADALNANSTQAYWTGTAFILASAVFQPITIALSDVWGRRFTTLAAVLIFAIGTIMCGAAHNIGTLIAGRTIQGVGGGAFLAMTYVVIADLFDKHDRPLGLSLIGMIWIVGSSCGPVMGGGFTTATSWRWIFWICLPIAGISCVLIFILMRMLKGPAKSPLKEMLKFDWGGAAISVLSLGALLIAISWGGIMFAWDSYQTILPLTCGAVGVALWLVYEHHVPRLSRGPTKAILPPIVFKRSTAVLVSICTVLMGIVQFGILYYLPLYYQASKGYSPLISGVALIPNCAFTALTTLIAGGIINRTDSYRLVIWVGWALTILGCGLLVLLKPSTSVAAWIFINVPSGIGVGCLFQGLNIALIAPQQENHTTLAGALSPFFRAIGQAFGICIGNAVNQNTLKIYLQHSSNANLRSAAGALAKNSASIATLLSESKDKSADHEELLMAFNKSLHAVWWTLMGISGIAGLLSLFTRHYSLRALEVMPSDAPMDEGGDTDTEREFGNDYMLANLDSGRTSKDQPTA